MADRTPAEVMSALRERCGSLTTARLNEAATRLLVINEILANVLGWPVEDFNPEEFVAAWSPSDGKKREWLDYHLRCGDALRLVVEAKRAGMTFALPSTRKVRKLPLKQLNENTGTPLGAAIAQAKGYSLSVGTHSFVVTNGLQWIASLSFAQNVRAEDLQAVVFYDLEDISKNLQEFIDLLSPDGIAGQVLMALAVSGGSLVPGFARRLNDVLRPGVPTEERNYLIAPMTVLMGTCFGDLTSADHTEMLEDCYVTSEATDEHLRRLESFVGYTFPHDLESAKKLNRTGDSTKPFGDVEHGLGSSLLVIGRAGSGKSTFLAITRKRLAAKIQPGARVLLHIDLEPRTQTHAEKFDHDRLVDEVCTDILVQAEERYSDANPFENGLLREIFAREIRRLRSSLSPALRGTPEEEARIDALIQEHLKKPANHLKAYLGYLDRRDLTATVLLDNVDRGTPEFEKIVFQLAQTLARNTNATVVTSLREATYQSGKTLGFLDVGRHTVLAISPPPFVEVAKRRFDYARNRLRNDPRLSKRFGRALGGVPPDRAFDFADIMSEMVLGEGRGIQTCIQALAGTNIRVALGLLEDFATSPNTNLDKLFREYRHGEDRQRNDVGTSLDSFLRSVMRMGTLRYSESGSRIINLFQASANLLVSHFTATRILQLLAWKSRQPREAADVRVQDLTARLGALGHTSGSVLNVLCHLGTRGLVNSLSKPEPPWSSADVVRLGAAGRYYLEELMFDREYIEGLTDDLIFYDESVFAALEHLQKDPSRPWHKRYEEKAKVMLTYLARRERDELSKIGAQNKRPDWLKPVAEDIGTRFFGGEFVQGLRTAGNGRRRSAR
jgi:hypothetical protein